MTRTVTPKTTKPQNQITSKNIISTFLISLFTGLIIPGLFYFFNFLDIIPIIKEIKTTLDAVQNDINSIQSNYIVKDVDGVEVIVGVSSELIGNQVSIFTDNKFNLKYAKTIMLSNFTDVDNFMPSMHFLVVKEVDRGNDNSKADIFISKDAAKRLGLKNFNQGIYPMKMKQKVSE